MISLFSLSPKNLYTIYKLKFFKIDHCWNLENLMSTIFRLFFKSRKRHHSWSILHQSTYQISHWINYS